MTEQIAIQTLLRTELGKIQMNNPAYSARSFAKKLGIAPSTINEVLNGKRAVSKKLAIQMMDKLAVDPDTHHKIVLQFDQRKLMKPTSQTQSFTTIPMDQYRLVAEWYHFAILSLTETENYQHDAHWIADRLNIKVTEAEGAMDRLERLGMVQIVEGKVKTGASAYHTSDHVANSSLRVAHAQNLNLARESLDRDSIDERDFCSMTMAIDPAKLPMAKQMIRDFRNKLSSFLEADKKTEVYKICVQLFPLTQLNSSQGEVL